MLDNELHEMSDEGVAAFTTGYVVITPPFHKTSSTVGDSVASELKPEEQVESKAEVFEALLVEHLNGIVFGGQIDDEKGWIVRWRERYAKAEGQEE